LGLNCDIMQYQANGNWEYNTGNSISSDLVFLSTVGFLLDGSFRY
jgi:hypothetical protein